MRVDKYLWCVRKYKTRSLASEAIKKGQVRINDEEVKASRTVKAGDVIEYRKEGISYRIKVLELPKSRLGAKLVSDYAEDQTSPEEMEKREFMRMMKGLQRKKGDGRPTKKSRRDLDDFLG